MIGTVGGGMSFKIAFIGAGSIGFTRALLRDILSVPEFSGVELAFTDISEKNLGMVARLCQRDIDENGLKVRIQATTDRREALKGARYIFNVARVGGLEAFALDVDIPLKYGVDQCVGDTLCAGGIMYGQRGIAAMLEFCADIREVAEPDALLLNYANPMAMMTWAANKFGRVRCVGLCHGVQHGHGQIADVIGLLINGERREGDVGYKKVTKADVDIVCAGINHQTWYVVARYRGEDWTGRLLRGFEMHDEYMRTEKVRIDVLRRFGYYSTESNGHLSEYLAWYRKRPAEIGKWIDMSDWINGETGGYLRVCAEGRDWFETDFPNWLAEPALVYAAGNRGSEHGSYIIEGLETGRPYRGHFNVVNGATISNLPPDAIVEVPGYVDRNGIGIPRVGELPMACAAICSQSVSVQRLAVEAAVRGDATLLKQAMLLDPLVGAVCDPPEAWQMADEMLVAEAPWLPQYASEIEEARKRLAAGGRIATNEGYRGAARLAARSVEEMARDVKGARDKAGAADKAKQPKAASNKESK